MTMLKPFSHILHVFMFLAAVSYGLSELADYDLLAKVFTGDGSTVVAVLVLMGCMMHFDSVMDMVRRPGH